MISRSTLCILVVFLTTESILGDECKTTYELKFDSMDNYLDGKSSGMFNIKQASMERYNKTIIISNVTVELTGDLCEDAKCSIQGFEKMGVEYQKGSLAIPETPCCELMEQNYWLYPAIVEKSNLPAGCPIKMDLYEVLNFHLDSCKLPNDVPGGDEWRFDIKVTCDDTPVYYVGVYLRFDRSEARRKAGQNDDSAGPPPPGR